MIFACMRPTSGMSISPREGRIQFTRLVFSCELSRLFPGGRIGKSPVPKQKSQPLGVELVRLVDLAHHGLGLPGIRQQREMAGLFHLIHHPIPVAYSLHGYLRTRRDQLLIAAE